MPAGPQEILLAERMAALAALQRRVMAPALGDEARAEAEQLGRDIEEQFQVLLQEEVQRAKLRVFARVHNALLDYRDANRVVSAARKALAAAVDLIDPGEAAAALEKAERALKAALAKGEPLLAPLYAAIEEAKEHGFVPAKPNNIAADLKAAKEGCDEAKAALAALKKDAAALYANQAIVGEPCMPCLEQRLTSILANDQHYDRALESAEHFSGRQHNKDSCALMSTQSILLERDGKAPPEGFSVKNLFSYIPSRADLERMRRGEPDMIDIGKASGAYSPCNGTIDEAKVMLAAGIAAVKTYSPTLDQVAQALDAGKAVIVFYDARPVWEGIDPDKWTGESVLGHAVRATGVDRDALGAVRGFWINDSGDGSAARYVEAKAMQMALDRVESRMSASDEPLLPKIK